MNYSEYLLKQINHYFFNLALEKHDEILGTDSYRYFMLNLDFFLGLMELIKKPDLILTIKDF
jgi:hypothetical protein